MQQKRTLKQTLSMLRKRELLFCEISPLCYQISEKKEICKRGLQDLFHRENFLQDRRQIPLPRPGGDMT